MNARDKWMDRNVDQLRVATKPKTTFGGQILSGKSITGNRGFEGRVEKNRPDAYFINSPERYFTTTGLEKGQTLRAVDIMPDSKRADTAVEYFGNMNGGDIKAPYVVSEHEKARRDDVTPISDQLGNAHIRTGHGDYGRDAMHILPNNRTDTDTIGSYLGGATGIVKAVISPLMDVLKPSRKENTIYNMRELGNAKHFNDTVYVNDKSRPRTTMREMTPYNPNPYGNINNQAYHKSGVEMTPHQAYDTHRDTTNVSYMGIGGSGHIMRNQDMTMYGNMRTNADKEQLSSIGQYSRNGVAPRLNVNIGELQSGKSEFDRVNQQGLAPQKMGTFTAIPDQYGYSSASFTNRDNSMAGYFDPYVTSSLKSNPYHLGIN